MDPNQNAGAVAPQSVPTAPENIMAQGVSAKKSNKGMIFGMVFLAILAIGGIGFGVWAYMDGNAQKDSLNLQVADLKTQNAKLLEQISGDEEEIIDENSDANAAGYIYVGEWGLKIKIPDSLEVITYTYDYGDGYTVLGVSVATKDGQSVPDFARIEKCTLGFVSRYSRANVEAGIVPDWYGNSFMSDDEYNYYYSGPQAVCTETQDYIQWESDTATIINNMLTNTENYSKI